MEVSAKAKHIHMSPRKIRLVVDVVRGLSVNKAKDQLRFINKLAVKPVVKLLESGIANAVNNYELEKDNLYIKEIKVDEGRTLRRWKPRAFGRATTIRKRSSHVSLILAEIKDSGKKEAKKQKIEAPVKLGADSKKEATKTGAKEDVKKTEAPKTKADSKKGTASKMFRRKAG